MTSGEMGVLIIAQVTGRQDFAKEKTCQWTSRNSGDPPTHHNGLEKSTSLLQCPVQDISGFNKVRSFKWQILIRKNFIETRCLI